MGSADGAGNSASSSGGSSSGSNNGSAGASDARPLSRRCRPSVSYDPRLGEVPVFDLVTSPAGSDRGEGVFSLQVRIWAGMQCNETKRRRRAERLSRLPMGVVPEAGAEALAGPFC